MSSKRRSGAIFEIAFTKSTRPPRSPQNCLVSLFFIHARARTVPYIIDSMCLSLVQIERKLIWCCQNGLYLPNLTSQRRIKEKKNQI